MVTTKDLEAFGDGWNRHDVEFLMTSMSDDCVFETTAGKEVCGTRYEGRQAVRGAFARVFKIFPDAHFRNARHFVAGNRGVSEGVFTEPHRPNVVIRRLPISAPFGRSQ